MSLHVIFIDKDGQQLSDVTSNFTSVQIPQNAFIMRIADDTKSYSNSTLTKLFEIDNTFYSKVLEYTTKGDYPFIDISVSDFGGFTAIFNQLSAQFIGNNPPTDIYDFSGYGGSGSGGNIDFSTIVTALNGISTALSALTNLSNLSNLADLANIVTAIVNKDNQSSIVDELRYIFTQSANEHSYRSLGNKNNLSVFKVVNSSAEISSLSLFNRISFVGYLRNISNKLSSVNDSIANTSSLDVQNKFLYTLSKTMRALFSSSDSIQNLTISQIINSSFLKSISDKLNNIETKLEQNLPFTTVVENDIVETNVSQNCSYGSKIEQIPFSE